jgi:tRNA A37 methylthiotransferase MiaB
MNRPYVTEDTERIFKLFNETGFKEFDTHIIVGFPGETEEHFEETMSFILKYHPKYVLVSKCMDLKTLPSFYLPDKVSDEVINKRIEKAQKYLTAAGIICNSEDGEVMENRMRRVNLI